MLSITVTLPCEFCSGSLHTQPPSCYWHFVPVFSCPYYRAIGRIAGLAGLPINKAALAPGSEPYMYGPRNLTGSKQWYLCFPSQYEWTYTDICARWQPLFVSITNHTPLTGNGILSCPTCICTQQYVEVAVLCSVSWWTRNNEGSRRYDTHGAIRYTLDVACQSSAEKNSYFLKALLNPLKTKRTSFTQGLSAYRTVNILKFGYEKPVS
jgi:hypothetical protein